MNILLYLYKYKVSFFTQPSREDNGVYLSLHEVYRLPMIT